VAKHPIPASPAERERLLEARRELKKACSVQAYVRGTTSRFYEWLGTTGARAVPRGPALWICGDCHFGNLGPIARADGRVEIELRDFDQAVVGNPAHDLIRLALSLAMVARGSDLPGTATVHLTEEIVRGYKSAFAARDEERPEVAGSVARPIRLTLKEALRRSWRHLLDERTGGRSSSLALGKSFWPLTEAERAAVGALFATESVRRVVTALWCRDDGAKVELVDAAYWVKGCSSLGGWRAAALIELGGKKAAAGGRVGLVDLKEALPACAPADPGADLPSHQGERVVMAARRLSSFAGERMLAGTLRDKPIVLRELLPQDLKIEIQRISEREAREVAYFLARIVGAAHARQLDGATRAAWLSELESRPSKSTDTPTWLWESIAALVSLHEGAYLEHCRRHGCPATSSIS